MESKTMKRFFVYAVLLVIGALGTTVLVTSAIAQETTATPTPAMEMTEAATSEATVETTAEATSEATETPAAEATAEATSSQPDATATPTAAMVVPEATREPAIALDLETITADPTLFVGQYVQLEGFVENLVNVRAFVLGEAAALDNDQILIINNSGDEFDIRLSEGARFLVTGRVYNSFADGGLTQLVAAAAAAGDLDLATAEAMVLESTPTAENAPTLVPEATDDTDFEFERMVIPYSTSLADMVVPEAYFNYIIVEITSITDLQFMELAQ